MRRYLLDTMTFLWMGFSPERLGRGAARVLEGTEGEFFYSMVNLWEIGIKMSRGGYREFILPEDWERVIPETFDGMGMIQLSIKPVHCRLVQDLPFHHKDPFDRMLIAQALESGLKVIGADDAFDSYGVERIW